MQPLIERIIKLTQTKQADGNRDELDPADQLCRPKGKSLQAGFQIDAHSSKRKSDKRRNRPVTPLFTNQDNKSHHAHHDQHEEFRRTEASGDIRKNSGQHRNQNNADRTTDKGSCRLHDESRPGTPLLGQRIAVKG